MNGTLGAGPSLQDLLVKLAPLLKLASNRGGPQGPGPAGTPAQIGQVATPNPGGAGLTPVLSTPQAVAVAPNPPAAQSNPAVQGGWFPNRRAASGAVATSAIDSIAQAITGFKQKRDSDNIAKAQNSLNMFLNAMEKGDMQVANLLAKDPKIIKSWEKYLKMEFPRVEGGTPGKPGGVNEPGGIAATQDTTAAIERALRLAQQQATLGSTEAATAEHTALASEATERGKLAGKQAEQVQPEAEARIALSKAQTIQANAAAALDQAKADTEKVNAGDTHSLNKAQANQLNAAADHLRAQRQMLEFEMGAGGTPAELNQIFSRDYADLNTLRNQAYADLQKLETDSRYQTRSVTGNIEEAAGLIPSYKDDLVEAEKRWKVLNKAVQYYNSEHDNIVKGKTKPSDAYQKAMVIAGFDTALKWAPPAGLPDPKGLKDGIIAMGDNNTPVAVVKGGAWAEPTAPQGESK